MIARPMTARNWELSSLISSLQVDRSGAILAVFLDLAKNKGILFTFEYARARRMEELSPQ